MRTRNNKRLIKFILSKAKRLLETSVLNEVDEIRRKEREHNGENEKT